MSDSRMVSAGRAGYAARGLVYALVAYFAAAAATGSGAARDTHGALASVADAAHGQLLIGLIAAGLAVFALWRLLQAFADVDDHGRSLEGLAVRAAMLVSAFIYAALAWYGASIAAGGGADGGQQNAHWTATLMAQPLGRWLVGAVGVVMAGAGAAHFHKARGRRFERHLQRPPAAEWIVPVSIVGLTARGLLFLLLGYFLVKAAVHSNAAESKGFRQVLAWLQQQPYGDWLLGGIAAGLAAFALYSIVEAIYRRR